MSALYLLTGFSLLVALFFLGAFFWAMRDDQYRDTHPPAIRIRFDDNVTTNTSSPYSSRYGTH